METGSGSYMIFDFQSASPIENFRLFKLSHLKKIRKLEARNGSFAIFRAKWEPIS